MPNKVRYPTVPPRTAKEERNRPPVISIVFNDPETTPKIGPAGADEDSQKITYHEPDEDRVRKRNSAVVARLSAGRQKEAMMRSVGWDK